MSEILETIFMLIVIAVLLALLIPIGALWLWCFYKESDYEDFN